MKNNMKQKLVAKTTAALAEGAIQAGKWGNEGCFFYFYEPKKPQNIENIDMKDVKDLFSK